MTHSKGYILKEEIKHRYDKLDKEYRDPSIEKSQRFKNLNILENKLVTQLKMFLSQRSNLNVQIKRTRDMLKRVKKERSELGDEQETIITEHALLRYIQRHMGVDIEQVHKDIMKLPKNLLIKSGNTVVTVYPTEPDNLSESEILEQSQSDENLKS